MAKRNTATATATNANGRIAKRAPKSTTRAIAPTVVTVTDMDTAFAFARTVTPDTFGASLRTVNHNHGVSHGTRNTNRWNGTRIEYTQNETFTRNAVEQLTDTQLLFVWCAAFPMATGRVFDANRATDDATMRAAIVNGVSIVAGARRSFNAGKHGNPGGPAVESVRYGGRPSFTPAAK
jgi:hypothetical protein